MISILAYFLFLALVFALYWWCFPPEKRGFLLLAASSLFASFFSLPYALYFLLQIAITYAGIRGLQKEGTFRKKQLKLLLVWLIGNLCFFKYIHLFLNFLSKTGLGWFENTASIHPIVFPLGMSYVVFRLAHTVIETYRKNIPPFSFVDFALYTLFFPTFLSGPVERFPKFHAQTKTHEKPDLPSINYGLGRIALGLARKFLVADTLALWVAPILANPMDQSRFIVCLAVYGLSLQIYMDFAGYTDIAIGSSRLFGYTIIENFNRPYLQKNIALFWRSWHISVYSWIRDYFFFPVFGHHASRAKTYAGIFCTMILFNLWHRGSWNFLILGIYHGTGLLFWVLLQDLKLKWPELRENMGKPFLTPLWIFVTFSFVSLGYVFFRFEIRHSWTLLGKIFSLNG